MATKKKRAVETATIHLPAPTIWPMIFGLGITLVFAGIVTHWMVTGVGAIACLAGVIGWWRDMFPHERFEVVEAPVAPPVPPPPAAPLEPGRDQHRVRLPVEIHPYTAGVVGGLAGAVSMAVVASIYGLVAEGSVWWPINLLAAMAMPGLTDAGPEQLRAFHFGGLIVASIIHVITSALVGLLYAVLLPMMPRRPLLLGGVITPVLWTALLYSSMRVLNPALDEHVNWLWFLLSQFAYGLTVGFIIGRSERIATAQLVPLVDRLGLERSEGGER